MANKQAFNTAARVLDRNPMQVDQDKNREINYAEFSTLKTPGLEDETVRRKVFNELANPTGKGKVDDIISMDDIKKSIKKVPVTAYDKMEKADGELYTVQARASQSTIEQYRSAGGTIDTAALKNEFILNTARDSALDSFAKYLGKEPKHNDVVEAVKKSYEWNATVKSIESVYATEQERIFKTISPELVKKMVDSALADKANGYEKISALDYSLTKYGAQREELKDIIKEVAMMLKKEKNKVSFVAESAKHLSSITDAKNEVGQTFVKAAKNAGVTINKTALLTAYDSQKAGQINTSKSPADTQKDKAKLEAEYKVECSSILSNTDPKKLVEVYSQLEKLNSSGAAVIFYLTAQSSGLSADRIQTITDVLTAQGNKPDPFSEKAGDQVLGLISTLPKVHR